MQSERGEGFWEKQNKRISRPITPQKNQEFGNTDLTQNQVKIIGQLNEKGQNLLGQIKYCNEDEE